MNRPATPPPSRPEPPRTATHLTPPSRRDGPRLRTRHRRGREVRQPRVRPRAHAGRRVPTLPPDRHRRHRRPRQPVAASSSPLLRGRPALRLLRWRRRPSCRRPTRPTRRVERLPSPPDLLGGQGLNLCLRRRRRHGLWQLQPLPLLRHRWKIPKSAPTRDRLPRTTPTLPVPNGQHRRTGRRPNGVRPHAGLHACARLACAW